MDHADRSGDSGIRRRPSRAFVARLKSTGFQLAVLAAVLVAVHFIPVLVIPIEIVAILVVAIIIPLAFPARYEDLISAISWLGIAAVAWLYFHAEPLALIAGVIGAISLIPALSSLSGGWMRTPK